MEGRIHCFGVFPSDDDLITSRLIFTCPVNRLPCWDIQDYFTHSFFKLGAICRNTSFSCKDLWAHCMLYLSYRAALLLITACLQSSCHIILTWLLIQMNFTFISFISVRGECCCLTTLDSLCVWWFQSRVHPGIWEDLGPTPRNTWDPL